MRAHSPFCPSTVVLSLLAMVVACSSTPVPRHADAGCSTDTDCAAGDLCFNGQCHANSCDPTQTPTGCPDGYTCDSFRLLCVAPDADGGSVADGGVTSPDDAGMGGGCATKYDCPSGQICVGSACKPATTNGVCIRDADCPSGFVCNFSHVCEPGCGSDKDCASPKICNMNTVACEVCSRANPCSNGQSCTNGACVAPKMCAAAADCQTAQAGLVCTGGACANCTSDSDCGVAPFGSGFTCSTGGLCVQSGCTDASCQTQFGAKAYCDMTSMSCQQYQCTADSDCTAPATCNTTAHTCGTSTMCDMNQCNMTCQAAGQTCDPTTCTCASGPACNPQGSGMAGGPCSTSCDCIAGLTCDPTMMTCGMGSMGTGSGAVGAMCSSNGDCASGNQCVNLLITQVCEKSCSSAADCGSQPCCALKTGGGSICSTIGMCF
jgi:hypothetical protein